MLCRALLVASSILFALASPARASMPHHDTVNAVVGDASWIEAHGAPPDARASEDDRLRTHLLWVHARLSRAPVAHLDPAQRAARSRMLDALHAYALAGAFPRHDTRLPARTPRFVDHEGRLCAVGHLVALTEGPEVARALNAAHELEYVMQMREPALDAWAARHGFTRLELATIQPSYGWIERPERPEPDPRPTRVATQADLERVLATAETRVLACLPTPPARRSRIDVRAFLTPRRRTPDGRARVHVVVDVRPASDAVARCVEAAVALTGAPLSRLVAPERTLRARRRFVVRPDAP